MSRHEWITVALLVSFGLVGAWMYEKFGDIGELLGMICVLPPAMYYLVFVVIKGRSV